MIVTITTAGGPRDIEAKVLDDAETLAVHPGCNRSGWTLSHLPSGHALVTVNHEGDAIEIGNVVLVKVPRVVLKLKNPRLAGERFPKDVAAWLARCRVARGFVPLGEVKRG